MDASGPIIAPPEAELLRYNRRVAGTVGMLSMRIFGAWRGKISEEFTLALADALQITNILRDVEEDAAIGRLYLRREALARAGVAPQPSTIAGDPGLPVVRVELGQRARESFRRARAVIQYHSRMRLAPALAMLGVYEGYLSRMERCHFRFQGPLAMSRGEKLRHGLAGVAFARAA